MLQPQQKLTSCCTPLLLLLLLLAAAAHAAPPAHEEKEMEVLMPHVAPKKEDTYLCTAVPLTETRYLKKFNPQHKSGLVHHIILAGCLRPGSEQKVWNCGEMQADAAKDPSDGLEVAPQCAEGTRMLYAYAMHAPALTLPEGVTFGVGPQYKTPYLVVQVHYRNTAAFAKDPNLKDTSGVGLVYQMERSPRLAGIHLSLTDGTVPAHSVSTMETACSYDGSAELHPFAFRTHTHSHGRVVSGFRVRNHEWKLIGSANPQMPQMFYPVNNSLTVRPGDSVAARCVMENTGDHDVSIGPTQQDEMCNFYMMYWVQAADEGREGSQMCYSALDQSGLRLWDSVPEAAALLSATVPGTGHIMRGVQRDMRKMDEFMRQMEAGMGGFGDREFEDDDLFDF